MTKKNKQSTESKAKKAAKEEKAKKEVPQKIEVETPTVTNFTRAQLASVLFISIGCSKIIELNAARKESFEDPKSCLRYLGEENSDVCSNESFSSLINAKYYSSLSLAAYLLGGMSILWSKEKDFQRFMSCFALSPVLITAVVTAIMEATMARNRVWNLIIVSCLLLSTIIPQSIDHIPFISDRASKTATMQSISLLACSVFSLIEVGNVVLGESDLANSLLQTTTHLPSEASTLVIFWLVDKLSMVLIFAFTAVHLEIPSQRVFLFFTSMIKLFEFYQQQTNMADPFRNQAMVEGGTVMLAVAAGTSWFF